MYALANNSVYLVPMLYFKQYCFLLLLHNVPIWDRGKCVSLAHFTSPVPVIHTWQCLCTKRVFFHCRTLSWPIVYCNISLRPISFLHCEPVIQRSWEICIFCRQLPYLAYQPVAFILCLCKFMPFCIHGWWLEATDRDLTKTLIWQTDYLAI